jgi:peptidoglycan hydrolase FlgJ
VLKEKVMIHPTLSLSVARPDPATPAPDSKLRALAADLEAGFLSEMLGYAGLGETSTSFGGGAGEVQFASFLRQEQAKAMVDAGGIGLAESLFDALKAGQA